MVGPGAPCTSRWRSTTPANPGPVEDATLHLMQRGQRRTPRSARHRRGCVSGPRPIYTDGVSDAGPVVRLDDELVRLAEEQARRTGRSRDEVINDALRRQLAADDLAELQATIAARSPLTFEQALALVYTDRSAAP